MRKSYSHWIKLQRKYRSLQQRLLDNADTRLVRKLGIIARRLSLLNRKWKLGITASVLSAWLACTPNQANAQGKVYPSFRPTSEITGDEGVRIYGTIQQNFFDNDKTGFSTIGPGDINGDGIDDMVIGSSGAFYQNTPKQRGAVHIVFGRSDGFQNPSGTADITNSVLIAGPSAYSRIGGSLGSAGDINGDGLADFIIGSPNFKAGTLNAAGRAWVVLGSESFGSTLNIGSLNGSNGFIVTGTEANMRIGSAISGIGDINNDGFDDIAFGAQYSNKVFVVFGKASGFGSTVDITALNGTDGFTVSGENIFRIGFSVSGGGDVNGDGIDDMIIGSNSSGNNGKSYVIFGSEQAFPSNVDPGALDGSNGFVIQGASNSYSGASVALLDVNNDGINDAVSTSTRHGNANIVFGKSGTFDPVINTSSLDGANGFVISIGGKFGNVVSTAGDINNDGLEDIMISDRYAEGGNGRVYMLFGRQGNFDANLTSSAFDGITGYSFVGEGRAGTGLDFLGDVNADGFGDIIIGEPYANSSDGIATVVFGAPFDAKPHVVNVIPDQNLEEDIEFSFALPGNIFASEATSLAFTATMGSEQPLPSWITFNPSSSTFSGTPNNASVGENVIKVIATDGNGDFASTTFKITVKDDKVFTSIASSEFQLVTKGLGEESLLGGSLSLEGDFNGDGFPDLVIGASNENDAMDNYSRGKVFVVLSQGEPIDLTAVDLTSLSGVNGFVVSGSSYQEIGRFVNLSDDFNGDGLDDLVIDSRSSHGNSVWVIFGNDAVTDAVISTGDLDGTNGFNIEPASGYFAYGASAVIDINRDGFADVVVGTYGKYTYQNGYGGESTSENAAFVIFGNPDQMPATFDLSTIDGDNGFKITGWGSNYSKYYGRYAANLGDFNGDGFDDLGISFIYKNLNGVEGYVSGTAIVFGSNEGFPADLSIDALDGSNGTLLVKNGYQVSITRSVGDLNGDGINEIAVFKYNNAYVVFGSNSPIEPIVDLTALDGTNGFSIASGASGVLNAGDFNADGFNDIWIGKSGNSAIIFGKADWPAQININDADGVLGIDIDASIYFDSAIPLGDVNGDGLDDAAFTDSSYNGGYSYQGAVFIVYGKGKLAPSVNNPLANQSATEDQPFNLQLPENFYSDANPTDEHAFSAKLAGGGELPSWLILNSATGAFTGTPALDSDAGTFTIELTITDEDGLAATDEFELTVTAVNDLPSLAAIANKEVSEGTLLTFFVSATDEESQGALVYSLNSASVNKGMSIISSTGQFSWTPNEEQNGTHQVTVTVSDGDAVDFKAFTITVTEVTTTPQLTTIGNQAVNEENQLTFTATASDADLPTQTLTFSLNDEAVAKGMSITSETGVFNWTPSETQDGTHEVTVTVSDGELTDSETLTITVNEVNKAPELTAENQTIDEGTELVFSSTATDPDVPQQSLTFGIDDVSVSKGLSIESNTGKVSWTPGEAQDGIHDVTITTSDGIESVSKTITVTVNEMNNAPVLSAIGNRSVEEGAELSFTATVSDTDLPAQTLTFSIDEAAIAKGMTINEATGAFSWTPAENQDGSHEVTVTVSDGELSNSETIMITVNEVNSAPVLAAIGNKSVDEGVELTFTATVSDAGLPAQTLTFSIDETAIAKGMTINGATGAFSWTPAESQDGSHEVTVTVSDGELSNSETIMITVNEVNSAPVLAAIGNRSVEEGAELSFTATTTDSDIPSQTLTYSIDDLSTTSGMQVAASTGVFSWTPAAGQAGDHEVTLSVSDGVIAVSQIFTITVSASAANHPPVIFQAITDQSLTEGFASVEVDISTLFTDEDGDELVVSAASANEAVATVSVSGQILTISEVGIGVTTVTVTAEDGRGGSVSDSFDVEVLQGSISGLAADGNVIMSIYPNPTDGKLSVNLSGSFKGALTAAIRSLSGQLLSETTVTGKSDKLSANLDLTALAPGIYMLNIAVDGKPLATKRIIKK